MSKTVLDIKLFCSIPRTCKNRKLGKQDINPIGKNRRTTSLAALSVCLILLEPRRREPDCVHILNIDTTVSITSMSLRKHLQPTQTLHLGRFQSVSDLFRITSDRFLTDSVQIVSNHFRPISYCYGPTAEKFPRLEGLGGGNPMLKRIPQGRPSIFSRSGGSAGRQSPGLYKFLWKFTKKFAWVEP